MPSLMNTPLELNSINFVPETHSWRTTTDHPISSSPLPVVDLSGPNVAAELAESCESLGAFQLVGHGVPCELLDRLESELLRLFSLPTEQKLKTAPTEGGVSGYGVVPIASHFSKRMWSEGFTFAGTSVEEHARKLWPGDPSQFCNVIEDYDKEMKRLSMRLMQLMLLSLGLKDDCTTLIRDPNELTGAVRLNSYPACPDPDRAMGMAAHSDSSLVTILYQNSTPGLQVLRPSNDSGPAQWATAPAVHGSLIVILGDLFHILTNGRFRSAYHRAVVNRMDRRLSAAYFCGPTTAKVSPLADIVVGRAQGPIYRGVTWPEYRDIKAELFQEALDSLKM